MKVIKKFDVNDWTYKHICSHCDSELEVEGKDIKHTEYPGDCRDPGYETWSATCIVCSNTINIPKDKIPKLIRLEAQKRSQTNYWNQFDR